MKKAAIPLLTLLISACLFAQEAPLRLGDLVVRARERSPRIKAAKAEVEASVSRIPQARSLPDPMVGLSFQNMGLDRITIGREVMSGAGLTFSQALPFPGKLGLRGEIAATASERKRAGATAVELEVLREVKLAYFELWTLTKTLDILLQQKTLLEKALSLSQTKYSVGQGIQSDVLKAGVEVSRMDEMIEPMKRMIEAVRIRINLLLDDPPEKPLGPPEDLPVSSLDPSLADIQKQAAEGSPVVKEAALMVEESSKMVDLAKKEAHPNFVVEGGWNWKGRLPDMYEIMIGVEIPLYKKTKQARMLEESVAGLRGSRDGLTAMKNDISSMIAEDVLKAETSENLLRLYQERIIPQSALAVESSMANYQVNKVDFLAVLSDINTLFSYRIALYQERSRLWSSIARLEAVTAREIVAWGGTDDKSR